jgi:hypothetical protein
MPNLKWEGFLSYRAPALGHRDYVSYLIPVSFFSSKGGEIRIIDLKMPQDQSLILSELSDAKTQGILRVFAEATENFMWRFDLWEIRARRLSVDFEFAVQSKWRNTLASGYRFVALDSTISDTAEPHGLDYKTGTHLLPFRFKFAAAAILNGFVHYSPFHRASVK